MPPAAADLDRTLATECRRFREVLANADPDGKVPSCDPWSATDLLWHLTEVQDFWAQIVARRLTDPEAVVSLTRPGDHSGTLMAFDSAHMALTAALGAARDTDPAWTWADDQTVGFIRRRQTHEALIHRVDAELTTGAAVLPADPAIAADGIEEMITVMLDGVPDWGSFTPETATLRVEASDHSGTWLLRFGRFRGTSPDSGNDYDLDTAMLEDDLVAPDCTIRGTAWDLDRWMWGRAPVSAVTTEGDVALVDRLRSIVREVTQ